MGRQDKGAIGRTEQSLTLRVTAIRGLGRHYPFDAEALRQFAVHVKPGWINPQLIARRPGETFDVKGRTGLGIFANPQDVIGAKDEDITAMRMDKIIAELVDKNLDRKSVV